MATILPSCTKPVQVNEQGPAHSVTGDVAGALEARRQWWEAFVLADTARLGILSDPGISATFSSGKTFRGAEVLQESAQLRSGAQLRTEWTDSIVSNLGSTVIVSDGVVEYIGTTGTVYRFLTVMHRSTWGWRIAAVQTTRELVRGTPIVVPEAELQAFAGQYRGPRGGILQIRVHEGGLGIEEGGVILPFQAVAPTVFETDARARLVGVLRLAFASDASGTVVSVTRLATEGLLTLQRVP